ncbi:MAG: hypothetical protein J3K34DRAFT_436564 [Monoraphidium minutum]|nr:MAG: hypothetical protein J3K34DRAFT_436564 [Monoraphidium minutum]
MARSSTLLVLLTCLASARRGAAQLSPNNFITSGDTCRNAGASAGYSAASQACSAARARCGGGVFGSAPGGSIGAVSLGQCANIAYGSCQQYADPWSSPCRSEMSSGSGRCSGSEFQSYYRAAAQSACYTAAQSVTGVNPGTNTWSDNGYYPGPRVPAVISPGSVVGGAIGSEVGRAIGGGVIGEVVGGAIGSGIGNAGDRIAINTISGILGRRMLGVAPAAAAGAQA